MCKARVMYFSVSRAATLLEISETAIFRLNENGQFHSLENESGSLMICSNSLLDNQDLYPKYRNQLEEGEHK